MWFVLSKNVDQLAKKRLNFCKIWLFTQLIHPPQCPATEDGLGERETIFEIIGFPALLEEIL